MDEIKKALMNEIAHCTKLQSMLCDVQLALANKINTLEEKMIMRYFWQVNISLAQLVEKISLVLLQDEASKPLPASILTAISNVRLEMQEAMGNLNKIVEYNTAFLEQYFEHDYYALLAHEYCFRERLEQITKAFSSSRTDAY